MASRILVVEDDSLNRSFLCAALKAGGFLTESIEDGEQVIEATRAFVPDLITMDINLRHVSGIDLMTAIRADPDLRSIPILAITAYVGKGDEDRIRHAGATAYLAKPISIRPFLATVDKLLRAAALQPADGGPFMPLLDSGTDAHLTLSTSASEHGPPVAPHGPLLREETSLIEVAAATRP